MVKSPGGLPQMRSITIEGREIPLRHERLPLDQVKLDADNPRIRHRVRQKFKNGEATPEALMKIIYELPGVSELQKTIRDNGGLVEPIFISNDGTVAEGNCRTVIYHRLRDADKKEKRWHTIECYRLPKNVTAREIAVLQATFHVYGKITWRSYEKIGHVHYMAKTLNMDPKVIAKRIGLQEKVVNRYIESYQTMKDQLLPEMKRLDPKVKDGDFLKKLSHFEEFYKIKKYETFRKSKANVTRFVKMVAQGKIPKANQVRKIADFVDNPKVIKTLEKKGFERAVKEASRADPTINSRSLDLVKRTTDSLKELQKPDLEDLKENKRAQRLLIDLHKIISDIADTVKLRLE